MPVPAPILGTGLPPQCQYPFWGLPPRHPPWGRGTGTTSHVWGTGNPSSALELLLVTASAFGTMSWHYASRNGHLGVCQLLLQRGARCDARTPGGATPLHRASYCGHLAVAQLLLAHGADPAATDEDGRTSLHKAAEQGHRELCALFLRHSPALASICDAKGRRPRDVADPEVQDLLDT
ncbi:PREDICTED: ankyrin repeat domain-containing protein 39 [Haliaeetus leucocephalus]|uniref:ankyrin repeat domain-containing protein 39 n=1 Tax=Haliaeetus leucocephalus TaxID=52644 RepID=UPI00053CBDD9|nr:PREDICTED: ankyrin repeat domain-containing protein 39 [Haliaeetus leucocephalus]